VPKLSRQEDERGSSERGGARAARCTHQTVRAHVLKIIDDSHVRLAFKKPWADGTSAVELEPLALIARLAALGADILFTMHLLSKEKSPLIEGQILVESRLCGFDCLDGFVVEAEPEKLARAATSGDGLDDAFERPALNNRGPDAKPRGDVADRMQSLVAPVLDRRRPT
jgi:hypothetical protein